MRHFDSVIVENHPKLCGDACLRFRDLIGTQLEVAIGLETIHPVVLPQLNKQMTPEDFRRTTEFLVAAGIRVRTFLLLRPPFLDEAEGIQWALRSMEFAFDCGATCCAVIPTRDGNGAMEHLAQTGHFAPPTLTSMEDVLVRGLQSRRGRVFVDIWDAQQFGICPECTPLRVERLRQMNLQQRVLPPVACSCRAT